MLSWADIYKLLACRNKFGHISTHCDDVDVGVSKDFGLGNLKVEVEVDGDVSSFVTWRSE